MKKAGHILKIISIVSSLMLLIFSNGCKDNRTQELSSVRNEEILSEIEEYSFDVTSSSEIMTESYEEPITTKSPDDNDEYNKKANSSSDFTYEDTTEGDIRILRYNGISADVIIPSRIENKVVTEIGDSTFKDLAGLEKVEIPSTVKSIGEYTFYNCIGLTSITLKDGLEIIKKSAFANCENLPELNLPITLTEIQAKAFSNCKKLKCIEIPDSVISFGTPTDYYEGGAVFSGCEALLSVKLSESQTCIPLNSFKDCTSLNDIKIPDSVRTLEEGAFVNCTSLKEIIIPGSVSEINYPGIGSFPDGPFGDCTSLEKVTINEGSLKTISYGMFGGCVSLKEIIIPENIIEIGKFAFNGCESLSQVKLPSKLQYLDINCFKKCVKLSEIIIPNTCIYIGEGAFSGCANLSSVTLPENVQAMTIEAFAGCAIQEITIPNNVTSFDFGYCEKLKNITVKGSNTELIISGYFGSDLGSDFNELTIYAPSGSKAETFAKENGVNFSVLN